MPRKRRGLEPSRDSSPPPPPPPAAVDPRSVALPPSKQRLETIEEECEGEYRLASTGQEKRCADSDGIPHGGRESRRKKSSTPQQPPPPHAVAGYRSVALPPRKQRLETIEQEDEAGGEDRLASSGQEKGRAQRDGMSHGGREGRRKKSSTPQQPLSPQSVPLPASSQPPPPKPRETVPSLPQQQPQSPLQKGAFHGFALQQPQLAFPIFPPPQQQQQQLPLLFTAAGMPASYSNKFEQLRPESQIILLQIEERIHDYKHESQRLDQSSRLYDLVSSGSFELVAGRVNQELRGINISIERENLPLQDMRDKINCMISYTDQSVRSYMMLRSTSLHRNSATTCNCSLSKQTSGDTASNQVAQLATSTAARVYQFYSGLPKKPSPFMQEMVAQFEKYLTECCKWIQELEKLLIINNDKTSSRTGLLISESLPHVMRNVYDYFIYVAAKVEGLHQKIESMKKAYEADLWNRGDRINQFFEAHRRGAARQEAGARRVHPTFPIPADPAQPSFQASGLIASSTVMSSSTSQQFLRIIAPESGSGSLIFSTSYSRHFASTSSFSLFQPSRVCCSIFYPL